MILFAAPPNVIELPDDDADVPLRPRRNKKASAGKTSQSVLVAEPVIQQPEDVTWAGAEPGFEHRGGGEEDRA